MTINLTCTIENLHSELSDLFGDDLTHSKLLAINRVCQMANMGYHGNFESHQAQKKLGVKVTLVPTSPTSEPFDPEEHAARRHHNAVHPSQHLTRENRRKPGTLPPLPEGAGLDFPKLSDEELRNRIGQSIEQVRASYAGVKPFVQVVPPHMYDPILKATAAALIDAVAVDNATDPAEVPEAQPRFYYDRASHNGDLQWVIKDSTKFSGIARARTEADAELIVAALNAWEASQ